MKKKEKSQRILTAVNSKEEYRGIYRSTSRNFGFVEFSGSNGDIIVYDEYNAAGAVHGDEVIVLAMKSNISKTGTEGIIKKVLKRSLEWAVCTITRRDGEYIACADKKNGNTEIIIRKEDLNGASKDDIVKVAVVREDGAKKGGGKHKKKQSKEDLLESIAASASRKEKAFLYGKVVEVFGSRESFSANYTSILASFGIEGEFDEKVLKEADEIAAEDSAQNEEFKSPDRLDLRKKIIFTIDSESSKDLDDAISIEQDEDKNYVLGVHIADVSNYVARQSALDLEAYNRGTSVYFADRVVPMLPKSLSNGICSLDGSAERLTLSVFMTIDKKGSVIKTSFAKSIIKSTVKGIYSEINAILKHLDEKKADDDESAQDEVATLLSKYKKVLPILKKARTVAALLKKNRIKKGSLELSSTESEFIISYDEESNAPKIDAVMLASSGESERMIEEFMVKANESVAAYLENNGYPCIYRVHELPLREKIEDFITLLRKFGYKANDIKPDSIQPLMLQKVLEDFRGKELFYTINIFMLRSLAKARYSNENFSHFGLASSQYCHFTSPIRRYPDLICHRILKSAIEGKSAETVANSYKGFIQKAADNSSEKEQNATGAERKIEDMLKSVYMSYHLGESFEGIISSVTNFGMFVMLENTCEGLVRNYDIEGYLGYNGEAFEISTTVKTYKLGMKVKIRVVKAGLPDCITDFVLMP